MSKPILLDLFCGAGGATKGYQDAGFYVVGVDNKPMPRYCGDEFVQADALEYLATVDLSRFHAIHASPPCQRYSVISNVHGASLTHPDLIAPTRALLLAARKPYVIENVPNAPLSETTKLCGSSFGLGALCHDGLFRQLRRHRLFESDWLFLAPGCAHAGEPIGVYGHGGGQFKTVWQGGTNRGYMGSFPERQEAMGIDWMRRHELSEAIPPAYTRYIGAQLMAHIRQGAPA